MDAQKCENCRASQASVPLISHTGPNRRAGFLPFILQQQTNLFASRKKKPPNAHPGRTRNPYSRGHPPCPPPPPCPLTLLFFRLFTHGPRAVGTNRLRKLRIRGLPEISN